jgi:rare lipoprotein A
MSPERGKRAKRALQGGAAMLAALLLLSACAETQLAATAAKSVIGDKPQAPARGIYKVGDPYQIGGVWYYPAEDYAYDETGIASWYGPDFHGKYTANGEIYDMNDLTAAHHTLPLPSLVRVTNLDNGRSIVVRVNDRGPFAKGRILDMSRRSAQLLGYEQSGTAKVRVQILGQESRQLAAQMKAQGAVQVASNNAARPYRVDVQPGESAPVNAPRAAVTAIPLTAPAVTSTPLPSPAPPQLARATVATAPGAAPAPLLAPSLAAKTPALVQVETQAVTQSRPQRTQIYVQAGAFANADNAQRLSSKLKAFGPTKVEPVKFANQQLFRVRVGPLRSVEDGDRTLDQVVNAGHPEARIVVD